MVNIETTPVVTVETGDLEGLPKPSGVRAFLGVPYAAPPVGALRWRPPQPAEPWTGRRAAQEFGPASQQFPPPANSLYYGGETRFSEDCLYLNVWTGPEGQTGRPVMVWLHFGAYQLGSAGNPMYDGAALAAEGVTVVSVNHRLGRLGFLAHPDLTAESGYGGSGNYGLMDQIAALQWVQRNVAAFGGDAENVTLFGVSAGGHSVHNLRCSPLSAGLFHKVIAQSAPGVAPALDGFGHPANPSTLAAGEQAGVEVARLLGVSSIEEMRGLPAEQIMAAPLPRTEGPWSFALFPGATISLHIFDSGYPVIDGHVLPRDPLSAFLAGEVADVPMIAGNAGNEASGLPYLDTLGAYRDYVGETFGERAAEVLALYPAATDEQARQASWDLIADQVFVWSTWTAARIQSSRLSAPAWYYRFLRRPPIPSDADLVERDFAGAFHGGEVPYVFGTFDAWKWDWTDEDRALSAALMHAWVDFARDGDPGAWPALGDGALPVMAWDVEPDVGDHVPDPARMAFWDRYHGVADEL
ncbi:carboxylesterase/lipase family protein [Amycolatopsis sp. GM8]|uniref:carboxylesterase/lipase family protein n=1 Tax=Amycolatopsis sp. GM8 TaxID=2896530 RepID=UPI001F1F7122|nr:carboxylesterase family protein [Amycolatopsis sp. GM8]